jgi:hypothetical protein
VHIGFHPFENFDHAHKGRSYSIDDEPVWIQGQPSSLFPGAYNAFYYAGEHFIFAYQISYGEHTFKLEIKLAG